jgi:hypothetical protein
MIFPHKQGQGRLYSRTPLLASRLQKLPPELEKKVNGGNPLPAGYSVSLPAKSKR